MNFPSVNPITSLNDLKTRALSDKNKPTKDEPKRFAGYIRHRRNLFEMFCKDLPKFARENPDLKFVVRPHPGENMGVWKEAFRENANVNVIREGASIPWLMAAKAIIHNGCTTAVEAGIIDHTPITYCPELSLENESELPNAISHRIFTTDKLAAAIKLAFASQLIMDDGQRAALSR
jgi:surface carbohydrate biosynthesis protein